MLKTFFHRLKLIFIPCQENKYHPKIISGRFLFYYAVVLLVLKLIVIPLFLFFPKSIFFADITKTALFEFTNNVRQSLGVQPLRENPALSLAAYLKAQDMLEKDYFAHYSPDGKAPWYWLEISGYNYQAAGENLAIGFLESEQVHRAWMDSSTHRENIVNPKYQEIGLAVLTGDFQGNETALVVQYFGFPRLVPSPQPQLVETEQEPSPVTEETIAGETTPEPEPEEPAVEEAPEELVREEELPVKEPLTELVQNEEKEIPSLVAAKETRRTPSFFFLQFMTTSYYSLLQNVIYGSLLLVIVSLLLTVFSDIFVYRRFQIDYKDAIFKTIGFGGLWFVLLFLDKLFIIQVISDNFRIN